MKNKFLFVSIICFIVVSCGKFRKTKFEYQFGEKNKEWVNMYKTDIFFSCLRKGYNNDTIFKLIAQKDLIVPYDPILFEYNKIDILTTKIIKNMPKPIYPHCDDCTEKEEKEETEKNYICASCLNYYASRELDSIAKIEYRKYLKSEQIK